MEPIVLVVGLARSGTTLIAEQLQTIGVCIGEETHVLTTPAVADWCHSQAPVSELFAVSKRMEPYRHLAAHIEENRPRSPDELLFLLSRANQAHHGFPMAGEKTPYHWKHVQRLLRTHDFVHVLFCIRDVRDVIDSHHRVPWGRRDGLALASEWNQATKLAFRLQHQYPDRFRIHVHEDFLASVDETMESYRQWLGLIGDHPQIGSFDESEWAWKKDATRAPDPSKANQWQKEEGQEFRYNRYAVIAAGGLELIGKKAPKAPLWKRMVLRMLGRASLAVESLAKRIVIQAR